MAHHDGARDSFWWLAVALASTIAVSAAAESAPPLPIPDARAVHHVVVAGRSGESVIEDPKVIARFVAFLKVRNRDWRKPLDTFPTPQWTIRLEGEKDVVLLLWLGPNWLGGREGQGEARDNRLRSLSEKDRVEALDILGAAAP